MSPKLSDPIDTLNLSSQCCSCLLEAGYRTIGEVAALGETGLGKIRRLSQESIIEVQERLDAYFAENPLLVRPRPLELLGLSIRPYNALIRRGIRTIEQLVVMSEEKIQSIPNIGTKSWAEIQDKLKAYKIEHSLPSQPMILEEESETLPIPPQLADPGLLRNASQKNIPLNKISIERLALTESSENLLRRARIKTIGELARQPRDEWEQEKQIGQRLNRYLDWLIEQDETLWADEVEGWSISPLLRLDLASESLRGFVQQWLSSLNERGRQIVEWRYGLYGERLTLEEAGECLGITRERVRQIEKGAIKRLCRPSRQCCVLPLVKFLRQVVVQAGGLVTEVYLGESLAEVVDVTDTNPSGVARLLMVTRPEFVEVKKVKAWALSDLPIKLIPEINRHLANILTAEYAPLCEEDILNRFKATSWYQARADELRDEFILACLHASQAIVCCDEDIYGLEKWERHYQGDIIVALRRLGQPAHYSEIAQAINEKLPPERHITPRAVHIRLMQNPDLFVWVGLRGTYGLREWGVERALTYEEALTQIFEEADHPLTYQQILARMLKVRPYYEEASLVLTLGTSGQFRSFPGDTYGLAEWREDEFREDYRLQRLFDEVEAVPSVTKPKTKVVEALDSVDGFIARAREETSNGH
jgi:RNA polymerase sigma factor (sigma-70 family)